MDDSLEYEPEFEPTRPKPSDEYEPEVDLEDEPVRSRAAEPPPLPRLWKDSSEPQPALETSPSPRMKRAGDDPFPPSRPAKPKKRKKEKDKDEEVVDDGTGATKLEETPALDTYEARQRARWIISGALGLVALIGMVVLLKAFKGSPTEENPEIDPSVDVRPSNQSKVGAEREARIILDSAKQADRLGKASAALDQLKKVVKTYQGTAAAREAMIAIARHNQELTLFGDDMPDQANAPKVSPPGTASANGPAVPKNAVASNARPGPVKPSDGPASALAPAATSVTPPPPPIVSKQLPTGYRPKFDFPIHASGWPTRIVCDRDGAEMVLVPASSFAMGREDGEAQERPTHEVAVSTFYIDLHEVTVRQYTSFLKESGRAIDAAKLAANGNPVSEDLPVVNVTRLDALAYCAWMKRRLPTEAQWELAARGPHGRISYWNGELPRKDPVKGPRPMESVMSLSTDLSPYGAFDMAANAWEWTSEFYDSKYYKQFRNRVVDPTGPKDSPARLAKATVKGGSDRGFLTWRFGLNIERGLPYVGFRGALPVEGAPVAPAAAPAPTVGPASSGGVQPF